jgi:hypothetical protein
MEPQVSRTTPPASATSAASRPIRVFVLIDALGWEIIKDLPFLNAALPVRMPLTTVLGYSSGAIPTILTGQTPAQTGHWNLFYYDPEGSPFRWLKAAAFLPERLLDNRYARRIIRELGRRVMGLGPLFECAVSPRLLPKFNWVEKENIYGERGIPSTASIFDLLKERKIPYQVYSYHSRSDSEICAQARHDIEHDAASFYFLYLSEFDHFLHAQCQDRKAVAERLAWYEQQLRSVFAAANKRDPQAQLAVMSDHGMTPVHAQYDLVGAIEQLGFTMPRQYLAVYDSTMARYWFFDDAARAAIIGELERTSCGRILADSELEKLGILFPDRRYGEVVFLFDPGWLFARSDFNGGGWQPAGMHGYHPADRHSNAIYLSNRQPARPLKTILDIYECLVEAAS